MTDTFSFGDHVGTLKGVPVNTDFTVKIEGLDQNNVAVYYGTQNLPGLTDDIEITITANQVTPRAPSNLRLTALTASGIEIKWQDNSSNEMGFIIERSVGNDSHFIALDTTIADLKAKFDDIGIIGGAIYYYRLAAYNSAGVSGYLTAQAIQTPIIQKIDSLPPILLVNALPESASVESIWVTGKAYDSSGIAIVTVNSDTATLMADSTFSAKIKLQFGKDTIVVSATDISTRKNKTVRNYYVIFDALAKDFVPPILTFTNPADRDTVQTLSPTLSGTATDASGEVVSFKVNNIAVILSGINWNKQVALPGTGWNKIYFEASDGSGNNKYDTLNLFVDTTTPDTFAPSISLAPLVNGYMIDKDSLTVNISVTDNGSGVDSVYVKGQAAIFTTNTWKIKIGLKPDSNKIIVIAKDKAGNQAKDSVLIILNRPPMFTTTTVDLRNTILKGNPYKDTVVATDTDGATGLSFIMKAGPSDMTVGISNGIISWLAIDVGTFACSVVVSDKYQYKDTIAWTIAVYDTSIHPVVKSDSMVTIPAGTFQMGSNMAANEQPVHSVTLSTFFISNTEVTQGEYQRVMGVNPSYFTGDLNKPVEQASWFDAALYCNKRSQMEGKDTVYRYIGTINSTVIIDYIKNGYRLPTEAEWEYACRAGTTTDYNWGRNYPLATHADTVAMDSNAICYHNSNSHTWPVAGKKSNAWGLYDMSGNVWELVNDWYGSYTIGAQTNPTGSMTSGNSILRGGSWGNGGDFGVNGNIRSAVRNGNVSPSSRLWDVGFRVVLHPLYPTGMKLIPIGTFQMGSTTGDTNELPVHTVNISRRFCMDSTEVTQEKYLAVTGINPSQFTGDLNRPVDSLTWFDALLFCNQRSKQASLDTVYQYTLITGTPFIGCIGLDGLNIDYSKNGYRLPTEAEWEYSCRAGTTTNYYWGSDSNLSTTGQYAWYSDNTNSTTYPVAKKKPNAYGLYDMTGNLWEFCNDWYGNYNNGTQTDPTGVMSSYWRIARGGGWRGDVNGLRSSFRGTPDPHIRANYIGFRCVIPAQ